MATASTRSRKPRTPGVSMELRPDNPLRPPNWRWSRAEELASGRGRRLVWDDDRTIAAQEFLEAWSRLGGELTGPGMASQDPAILGSLKLLRGNPRRRSELEARILARQSDEEISSKLGVAASVIATYESLFFSVREKVQASDWIMAEVIGPRIYQGLTESDLDLIWKLWAFRGGPLVLDALIATHDADDGGAPEWFDPATARSCEMVVAVSVLSASENPAAVLRLQAFLDQLEVESVRNDVAVTAKLVVVMSSDVPIDLKSVRGVRAGCSTEVSNRIDGDGLIDPAVMESGPDDVLSAVLRSTG